MIKFKVFKENETLDVVLVNYKNTNKYSYVNLTKGHICSCVFDSIEQAIADIEQRKKDNLLIDYKIITEV